MMLFASQLQCAGLAFLSAKVRGNAGQLCMGEVLCASAADADRVAAWCQRQGYAVAARVATDEELEMHKSMQEAL